MKKKEELSAPNALPDEELDSVSGGVENESDLKLSRHNVRSPLTGAGLIPPSGAGYDDGEKKAPNPYIELGDDISF